MTAKITAILLTHNEDLHIERCLRSLNQFVDRVVVVDSFSSDRTVDIARSLGAQVLQNKWINYANQFQWGVDNAEIDSGWILRIDADEYFEEAAIAEIAERLPSLLDSVTAIEFKRKVYFRNQWIRWGGYYGLRLTRLWRVGAGSIEQRWMDEHIAIDHGTSLLFSRGDLVDNNLKDITWWTEKHNGYATRQMIDFINLEYGLFAGDQRVSEDANGSAKWKRFLRNTIFGKSPLYLRSLLYYVQRYFFRLGFLDGRQGFVFHFLQGFWNFMLIDAKIDEARTYIAAHGLEAFKQHLADRFGITDLAPVRTAESQTDQVADQAEAVPSA